MLCLLGRIAEVALPKRRQAGEVPPPAKTLPARISPQPKR